jgi:flagellar hook-associated protein 3 FlgL
MRITTPMMSNIFVSNLRRQAEAMLQRQEQIASQKRINRPSDDPNGMARVLGGRSTLAAIDQYAANIQQGKSRLEFSEEILRMVDDLVQQARGTAQEKSGDGISAEERRFAAGQIKEIYDQMLQLANSRFGGRYMFAGHQSDTVPFARDGDYRVTYSGDGGSFRIPIAEDVEVTVDADGRNYFHDALNGGVNIFDELRGLINGLENTDLAAGTAQIRAVVDPLEDGHVQIMNKRSEYAPKLYRLQATKEHWSNLKPAVQAAISREEDVDLTQAIIELKNLETAYEASMATAARIIQSGLVNFLK